MDYGIISRIDLPEAQDMSKRIIEYLIEYTDICVEEGISEKLDLDNSIDALPLDEMDVDTLITVGGDGTILRALQKIDAAIFAVNMGRVGFLTEVNGEGIEEHLDKLLNKEYYVEQRSKLRITIEGGKELHAVNEAVIHTAQISKIRDFNIFVGDVLAENIRSDGLIIATPTGSTCYAMSAGSPIIDPQVPAHVIVPIAPYKLSTRPLVVPATHEIRIHEVEGRESILVVDGQNEITMSDEMITCTRSPHTARFIRFHPNFYQRVREKFLR